MKTFRVSPLWRSRNFRLIWMGQTASIFGDRVTDVALPLLILQQTPQPFVVALLVALRAVPVIVLGLVAGVIADRIDRRVLMVACDLGRAAALCTVVALGVTHHTVPLALLAAVVLVLSIGQLGFGVAHSAWLPDVTSDALLGNAYAALEASDAIATVSGPALSGTLIQLFGPAITLGADACSYLASTAALLGVHITQQQAEDLPVAPVQPPRHIIAEALEGANIILHSPEQRLLKGIGTALYFGSGAIVVLLAVLTSKRLHLPPWQIGLVYSAAGIGGLIGSMFASQALALGWRRAMSITLTIAALGNGGLLVASLIGQPTPGFIIAFGSNLVLDGAVALSFIITGTIGMQITPRAVRGRVNAVSAIYVSVMGNGFLVIAGALTAGGNPLLAFAVLVVVFSAAAIAAGRSHPVPRL